MSEDKLLTPPQVARHLQVNERTVTQWLRRGHLRGFKIGKEWRISARDLEHFLEQNANVPVRDGPNGVYILRASLPETTKKAVKGRKRAPKRVTVTIT